MLSERLGHADVTVTLKLYVHTLPHHDAEAAEVVAAAIRGARWTIAARGRKGAETWPHVPEPGGTCRHLRGTFAHVDRHLGARARTALYPRRRVRFPASPLRGESAREENERAERFADTAARDSHQVMEAHEKLLELRAEVERLEAKVTRPSSPPPLSPLDDRPANERGRATVRPAPRAVRRCYRPDRTLPVTCRVQGPPRRGAGYVRGACTARPKAWAMAYALQVLRTEFKAMSGRVCGRVSDRHSLVDFKLPHLRQNIGRVPHLQRAIGWSGITTTQVPAAMTGIGRRVHEPGAGVGRTCRGCTTGGALSDYGIARPTTSASVSASSSA